MAAPKNTRQWTFLCLVFVCACWAAFSAGRHWAPRSPRRASSRGVFVLDIHFTFKSMKDRDVFVDLWKPLAKHVLEKEAGTISYELSIADSDPLKVQVYERYATKDDYHIHKASKPFEEFHVKLAESGIEWSVKEGQSYYETGIGFVCEWVPTSFNMTQLEQAPPPGDKKRLRMQRSLSWAPW